MSEIVNYRESLLNMCTQEKLSSHMILMMCLKWMTQQDIKDMLDYNEITIKDSEDV